MGNNILFVAMFSCTMFGALNGSLRAYNNDYL
jgi:hypothetical protein